MIQSNDNQRYTEVADRFIERERPQLVIREGDYWEFVDGDLQPRTPKQVKARIWDWMKREGLPATAHRVNRVERLVWAFLPDWDRPSEEEEERIKLAEAKEWALRKCSPGYLERKWKRAGHVDSYGSENNRVEYWTLEGSPPKAHIIYMHGIGGYIIVCGCEGGILEAIP